MKSVIVNNLIRTFGLAIILSCSTIIVSAASGIFQTYIILDVNGGGDEFFAGGEDADMIHAPFDGVAYGQVSSLVLNGGEVKTFKNGLSDVFGAELFYNIHLVSEPAGAFIPLTLPFESDLPNPGDQRWQLLGAGIDVMDGLSPGTYELEVFWKATSSDGDHFDSNGGLNYSATFVIPEANENCSNAIPITPSVLGVQAWETFSLGEVSSEAGCIGNADDDIWFSFVAESPNDIIVAQDPSGTYDAVVEIYSDCGNRIDCFDNYGPGEVERALSAGTPGDEFEVGTTYYFRVYNKATGVTGSPNVRVMVKTFEEGGLKSKYCDVFDYVLSDQIWSFNDAAGQLYSNPVIGVSDYRFRFRETTDSTTYNGGLDVIAEPAQTGAHGIQLDDVPGLEYGKLYLVSVGHKAGLLANGGSGFYWSAFSDECVIGMQSSIPSPSLLPQYCSADSLFLKNKVVAEPVNNAEQYEFTFDGPGGPFVEQSSNRVIILSTVGTSSNGLQYEESSYTVTVRARIDGVWGDPGTPCVISMAPEPENTQLLNSSCGLEVELPTNTLLKAKNIKGSTSYEFEFTPLGDQTSGVLTRIRPTRIFQFANTPLAFESGDYSVRVRTFGGNTWGSFSTACTITVLTEGGEFSPQLDEIVDAKLLENKTLSGSIYPNPNKGQEFRISIEGLDEQGSVQLILRDIQGRVIDSQQMAFDKRGGDFLWRTNGSLETGIYLMELQSDMKSTTVRFMVE